MAVAITMMLFGVLGIMIGWKIGSVWGATAQDNRQYWIRNAVAVLTGIVVCAFIAATGFVTLTGLGVGLVGGAVAGLKMGFGKSVGVWQKHDSFFRVNKDQVKAAKSAREAREAGESEQQRAVRDMVSVTDDRLQANGEKGRR